VCPDPGDFCADTACSEAANQCVTTDTSATVCPDPGDFCADTSCSEAANQCVTTDTSATVCPDNLHCADVTCNEATDQCDTTDTSTTVCPDPGDFCADTTCDEEKDDCVTTDTSSTVCPQTECKHCNEDADKCADTAGTACGDPSDTVCTEPDTCDGDGVCQPNNEACSFVTDSSLCTFDVGDACGPETREFRLLFTPDAQNWIAYKLNGSNPGQYYYNLFVDGTEGEELTVQVNIPWPFVTQGAMPVHIYDGALVHVNGCFVPPTDGEALGLRITLGDWVNGNFSGGGVFCPKVVGPGPNGNEADNFCTMQIPVTIPESGQVYVNIHLDYMLKGTQLDVNPVDTFVDRYDKAANLDALVNTPDNTGDVALPNCREHRFCHTGEIQTLGACDSLPPESSSAVYNANEFKKIAGVFGRLTSGVDGVVGTLVQLKRPSQANAVVAFGTSDADGYYLLAYKHTGKAEIYNVVLPNGQSFPVTLKANGWAEMNFSLSGVTWSLVP
jgi:hypothetical protein